MTSASCLHPRQAMRILQEEHEDVCGLVLCLQVCESTGCDPKNQTANFQKLSAEAAPAASNSCLQGGKVLLLLLPVCTHTFALVSDAAPSICVAPSPFFADQRTHHAGEDPHVREASRGQHTPTTTTTTRQQTNCCRVRQAQQRKAHSEWDSNGAW